MLLWTADGYLDASDRLPVDGAGFTHAAAAGDIDSDGDIDILVGNNGGDWIPGPYFLINDGRANFVGNTDRLPERVVAEFQRWPWAVALADFDADGNLDLLAGAREFLDGKSFVYWGSPEGEYRDENVAVLPTPSFFTALRGAVVISAGVHDVNGDDRPDILLGGYDSNFRGRGVQLLMNIGKRAFVDETPRRLGASAWSTTQAWHMTHSFFDFNGDGTVDIVPQHYWDENGVTNVLAWLNDGTGYYVPLKTVEFDDGDALARFSLGRAIDAGSRFKYMEFFDYDAKLTANAAVVVQGAVIRRQR